MIHPLEIIINPTIFIRHLSALTSNRKVAIYEKMSQLFLSMCLINCPLEMVINTALIYMKWVREMKNKEVRRNRITVALDNPRSIFWQTFQKTKTTLTCQPRGYANYLRRNISLCGWFRLMSLHLRRHTNWSPLHAWIFCQGSQQCWTFRRRKSNPIDLTLCHQTLGSVQHFQSSCQTHLQ